MSITQSIKSEAFAAALANDSFILLSESFFGNGLGRGLLLRHWLGGGLFGRRLDFVCDSVCVLHAFFTVQILFEVTVDEGYAERPINAVQLDQ